MIPRLVAISGWPGTGKSTVRKWLSDELGFASVSHDDLIREIYGLTFDDFWKRPDFTVEWRKLREQTDQIKMGYLSEGCDVAVEGTFHYDRERRRVLNTGDIVAQKYLIILQTNEEEIIRRVIGRGGQPFSFDGYWRESTEWPTTGYNPDLSCEVIAYSNNTREEEQALYTDLRRRFERTNPITTPK